MKRLIAIAVVGAFAWGPALAAPSPPPSVEEQAAACRAHPADIALSSIAHRLPPEFATAGERPAMTLSASEIQAISVQAESR
ncbi:exported hypothetical protein [Hyphomicrobiales bacterium]|nr:exported hypothetical protein [Hyphomicrobiales bacterium]CAH1697402.1 exported hypothetical protein [Hyphomicrobiales bacterium]CAI0345590.1 exported hypothetical protein [Hyphomicrobiales bacterium]